MIPKEIKDEVYKIFNIEKRDEWISKNADIIELLGNNGFYAEIKETTTNLLFFEKRLEFPFSLGEDITDETLSLDSYKHNNYEMMEKYYDKYKVRISLPDFYQKRIIREHIIFITYCIRLNVSRNVSRSNSEDITIFAIRKELKSSALYHVLYGIDYGIDYKNIREKLSKGKRIKKNYLREKEYRTEITIETIKTAIKHAQDNMTEVSKIIEAYIPKIIEDMRLTVKKDYEEYEKAIVSMKLQKFLDGALIQFDALNP